MKTIISAALISVAMLTAPVAGAQDSKAAPGAAASDATKSSSVQIDEHMKKMQALHERMMRASSPEERQKLREEARKEMQEGMTMMGPMMQGGGAGSMGRGPMGGGMTAPKAGPADATARMQMMEKRMDMMQMMMQMMMDQQEGMGGSMGGQVAPRK